MCNQMAGQYYIYILLYNHKCNSYCTFKLVRTPSHEINMYMLVFPQISNFNMSMQRFKSNINQMDLTTSMIRILHVIEGEFLGGGRGSLFSSQSTNTYMDAINTLITVHCILKGLREPMQSFLWCHFPLQSCNVVNAL